MPAVQSHYEKFVTFSIQIERQHPQLILRHLHGRDGGREWHWLKQWLDEIFLSFQ